VSGQAAAHYIGADATLQMPATLTPRTRSPGGLLAACGLRQTRRSEMIAHRRRSNLKEEGRRNERLTDAELHALCSMTR
jgi:hypothetical protein